MDISIFEIVAVAGVLCLASMVQSAIGFAYGLVSTPLLIWIGIELPSAITIVATCSLIQAIIGARHLRASIPWRLALIATAVRMVMLIVGLLILRHLADMDTGGVRLVVGIVLCVLVITQLCCKVRPVEKLHWFWGALAFSTSGLLAGTCGIGGPPLVLWTLGHTWPAERVRGFLFAVFATTIPAQIVLLYLGFGMEIAWAAGMALLLVPAVFLGAAIGLPLGNKLSRPVLSGIVYATLLVIGLSSVIPQVIQNLL